jgi:hypothetical protein
MGKTICLSGAASGALPRAFFVHDGKAIGPLGFEQAPLDFTGDPIAFLKSHWPDTTVEYATLDAGEYHPRMFRSIYPQGQGYPSPEETGETPFGEFLLSVEQESILCDDLSSICRVVHPSPANKSAFGSAIRNLLMATCTEIESQFKGIMTANRYPTPPHDRWSTKDYVRVCAPMKLDEYKVRPLRYRASPPITPFIGWNAGQPTKSLPWYDAYNATKHDRQGNLNRATLEHAIAAVAALNVLLLAQYGLQSLMRYPAAFAFFSVESLPLWEARDCSYPPLRGGSGVGVDFRF